MQFLLAILLLFINPVKDLNKVAETNALKKEAKEAFEAGNYDKAVENYEMLTQALGVTDENILSNLANAYYKQGNVEQAISHYQSLTQSEDSNIRSDAYNQMGIIAHQQQQNQEALNHFKEALKANPSNEAARFNYSKLKKEQEENQDNQEGQNDQNNDNKDNQQNKDQQNQDQNQQDQENQDQEDQSGEGDQENENEQENQEQQDQGNEQQENHKSMAEKLEEMNMTEEKAQMILEAMKNNEIQYIQQNKKKPQSRVDDGRPDW